MAKNYDFDEPERDGIFDQFLALVSSHKRAFAIFSVAAAVVLLGIILVGAYPEDDEAARNETVPIVRADGGDYKTAPDSPGGMEIPYRDSTVFSSMEDDKNNNGKTENILADDKTEQPMPKDQLFAGLNTNGEQQASDQAAGANTDTANSDIGNGQVAPILAPGTDTNDSASATAQSADPVVNEAIGVPPQAMKSTTGTAAPATPVEAVTIPQETADTQKADKADPADEARTKTASTGNAVTKPDVAKTEPAAGAATTAKAVTLGGYYVQLASVREKTGAAGEFKKLQAKYASLSGLDYRTQEANLGAKGTFHRIQAGPMSKESANSICGKIKAQSPGACLVVAK